MFQLLVFSTEQSNEQQISFQFSRRQFRQKLCKLCIDLPMSPVQQLYYGVLQMVMA